MRRQTIGEGLLLLLLAACGPPGLTPKDQIPADSTQRYAADALVLENAAHGPELCLGGVQESLPPQCGGVPVAGWDWDEVSGEKRHGNAIYGDFHVVGTYDGTTFTLTETPGEAQYPEPARIGSACAEPAGGWERPRPDDASESDLQEALAAASGDPDYAGFWIDDPNPPLENGQQNISLAILNFAFTGNLEQHTAELRAEWGGALCVSKHEHTAAELQGIRTQAEATLTERGLTLLFSDADEVRGVVSLEVVFFEADDQAALDAKYGAGVVVLSAALRPV